MFLSSVEVCRSNYSANNSEETSFFVNAMLPVSRCRTYTLHINFYPKGSEESVMRQLPQIENLITECEKNLSVRISRLAQDVASRLSTISSSWVHPHFISYLHQSPVLALPSLSKIHHLIVLFQIAFLIYVNPSPEECMLGQKSAAWISSKNDCLRLLRMWGSCKTVHWKCSWPRIRNENCVTVCSN